MASPDHSFLAEQLWAPQGWQQQARLRVDAGGMLVPADGDADDRDATASGRFAVPGLPNIHSHAFQRAMAGLAERQSHPEDSFWTWREVMYGFAARITPEQLRDIAAQLYAEMLCAGYTAVCEFHYLHHAPDGQPYADPAEMSLALVEAARDTGIGLTLLPVLYMRGGFDGRPLAPRQQRFGHEVDAFLALIERLLPLEDPQLRIGMALHSLRAVPEAALREIERALPGFGKDMPVHIHIAEQQAEVEDCLAVRGARPVQWLLDHADVDQRWTLVHATHLDGTEVQRLARSGATVALCPTTEANLGDGLFPLRDYIDAGGRWGIGSDSHVSVSPVEELRWLEYGQRLRALRRNIASSREQQSVGETLFKAALAGGAAASGRLLGALAPGHRADWLVLDDQSAELAARDAGNLLDTWLFSGNRPLVHDVFAGGRQVVAAGRHANGDAILARYRHAVETLAST